MALVAHLRGDLGLGRAPGELPRLGHRPGQRLLDVDVLAEIHRRQRDGRVHVIGRRHDHRVDVLLLLEHPAVVLVARGFGAAAASACCRSHVAIARDRSSGVMGRVVMVGGAPSLRADAGTRTSTTLAVDALLERGDVLGRPAKPWSA